MTVTHERPRTDTLTTIVTRIRERATTTPAGVAMREKRLGIWQEITWADYWDRVLDVAHGLLALGVAPRDTVAIHSENRPEWLFADLGIVAVRAITVGLYPTNPPAEVRHILADSRSRILFAEDQEQVDKALEVAPELPHLERIIYVEPRGVRSYTDERLLFWDDFLAMGRRHREQHPGEVEDLMAASEPDDVLTLVYTSGTTGPPKGAMLSIANAEFAIEVLINGGGFAYPPPTERDVMLSYLPLCHIAERIFTAWFNAATGVQVNFAESIETVQQDLREVQPTVLFGVPRIWEKIAAGVHIRMANATLAKRIVFGAALKAADRIGDTLVRTGGNPTLATRVMSAIGDVLVFRALKDRIGLRMVRHAASGAAPIAPEVLKFFMGIGIPMYEVYGQTENTAVATANRPGRIKLGTVGEPHPGVELRIDEETGEILTRHAGTFLGYWDQPEATARTIDEEGWLHSGDVAEWVDGTHVKITDRLKDIIITAGGKNVAPSEIENALKASPYIKEAVVIGDSRRYLTALIGIELDTVGDWAARNRLAYTTYRDLSEKPEVIALVQKVVDEVNGKFSRVEGIKRFTMLPKELDHEDGELTATQKVKRAAIAATFGDLVESMYSGAGR